MKNLTVTIRAQLEIPDDWQLVEHPSGIQVLKIDDHFVDFDIAPLVTTSLDPEAVWSDENAELVDTVLDAVVSLDGDIDMGRSQ